VLDAFVPWSAVKAAPASGAETCAPDALHGAQLPDQSMPLGRPNPRPSGGERLRPGRAPAEARPQASDGVQHAVARTKVPPSLPPTTAPVRKPAGHRIPPPTRHRRVPVELILVVRRAERAAGVADPRVPGRYGEAALRAGPCAPRPHQLMGSGRSRLERIQLDVNPRTVSGDIDDQR
jgi:hypothetical protein